MNVKSQSELDIVGRETCVFKASLMQTLICSGVLITGGLYDSKKASIYFPATKQFCALPDLPTRRYYHSQVGLRACGGTIGNTNCDTWNPETGSWNAEDVQLIGSRAGNSWTTANGEGTYLIGSYSYGDGAYGWNGWNNAKTQGYRDVQICL